MAEENRHRISAMRQFFFCVLLSLLAVCAQAQSANEPILKSYDALVYPPIARAARVSGQITVEFQLNGIGETTSVSATNGPAMLRGVAENFVKSWKFDLGSSAPNSAMKYQTTIEYKAVKGAVDPRNDPNPMVQSDSFHHFDVKLLISDIKLSNCPTGKDEDVPPEIVTGDFAEVSRYACMGSCPNYTVRVQEDGVVAWRGESYVDTVGERKSSIDKKDARALLEKFRTKEFWSYCGDYTDNGLDGSSTSITVKLGGRTRTISDHDESGPNPLQELLLDIDRTADSHRWRHGNPKSEPITRLRDDAYLPKPGVTPLMLATADKDANKLRGLIADGADVKQTDASGWTALMYGGRNSFSTQILLKAGADPNQSSPHGDTPLMVSCLSGDWDDDLVEAGANVNAQNQDGQTALMFLAARDEVDAIRDALRAGASASLKDAKGRTALDYLKLASCGKSPLYDRVTDGRYGYTKCTAFDKDDRQAAEKLLKDAENMKK
jgi:hypothetical protein